MSTPAKSTPRARAKRIEWDDSEAVDAFIKGIDHLLKPALEAIRKTILDADLHITEGIKWNSPSFYSNGWFATANTRDKDSVLVVFHLGAKVKDNSTAGVIVKEDQGLLEWVAKDRALARFHSLSDVTSKQAVLRSIVKQWIAHLA